MMVGKDGYLKGVLDAVSRLPDADGLQHTSIPELPQHQAVIETQRELGRNESESTSRSTDEEKLCLNRGAGTNSDHLLCIGADTLDKVGF